MNQHRLIGFVSVLCLMLIPNLAMGNVGLRAMSATFRVVGGKSSGTAFAVTMSASQESESATTYLVTAAHVFKNMQAEQCQLILRRQQDDAYERHAIKIDIVREGQSLWTKHPELDLAVLPLRLPEEAEIQPFPLEQVADQATLDARRVQVGQSCFVPCFPVQLEANAAGWPVLRRGTIASHPLSPVTRHKTFMLDYSSFGGDSGSPVVTSVSTSDSDPAVETATIVGIVIGQHRQTDRVVIPFEERTVHHPLGLGICIQAHFIHETIRLSRDKTKPSRDDDSSLDKAPTHG